jgi:hypothetical protein
MFSPKIFDAVSVLLLDDDWRDGTPRFYCNQEYLAHRINTRCAVCENFCLLMSACPTEEETLGFRDSRQTQSSFPDRVECYFPIRLIGWDATSLSS